MAETKKVDVTVTDATKELVIRTGDAAPPQVPLTPYINGQINAVGIFIANRGKLIDKQKAVILVDYEKRSITLQTDVHDNYGSTVTGRVLIEPKIEEFGINSNTRYTREGLVSLLRLNRFFFPDKDAHAKLLASISRFEAQVKKDVLLASDGRGNASVSVDKKVDTGVPFSFVLEMPVIRGGKKKKFEVEVCLDVTDGGVKFWLESIELAEILETDVNNAIELELQNFEGFAVIPV